MGNVVFGKFATASNFVAPFSADRAVDGALSPVRRWVGNVPCYLSVNIGSSVWINRWVVTHMSAISGWNNPGYSMNTYSLQGSMDGVSWITLDTVSGNTSSRTDRTFNPTKCAFVRVVVNTGLNQNNGLASIMELEVYDIPPTSQYLSNLTISSGTLVPAFTKNSYNYTASVGNEVSSIVITPTAETPSAYGQNAKIMVGTTVITSGQSVTVPLNVGENTIDVVVTSAIGGLTQKYIVVVTRADVNLYLSKVILTYIKPGGTSTDEIVMNHTETSYSSTRLARASKVTISPFAEDSSVTITINTDQTVPSGGTSSEISLLPPGMSIPIKVAKNGSIREYTIIIN